METNTQNQDQIVDELRQACCKCLNEVPSLRRTWPKSIKERVLRLVELGLSCEDVSRAAGISAATIYGWKAQRAQAQFLPVKVVEARVVTTASTGPYSGKSPG